MVVPVVSAVAAVRPLVSLAGIVMAVTAMVFVMV